MFISWTARYNRGMTNEPTADKTAPSKGSGALKGGLLLLGVGLVLAVGGGGALGIYFLGAGAICLVVAGVKARS